MAGRQWRNASIRKCEHSHSVLGKIVQTGVVLPGGITSSEQIPSMGWALMDLAEAVADDDSIWAQLPRTLRIDGLPPLKARAFLRRLVQESK